MAFTAITSQATLINNIRECTQWAMSPQQRKAIQVYAKMWTLKQVGGTNYTSAIQTLNNDAAALLNGIGGSDLDAAKAAIDYNEARVALYAGGSTATISLTNATAMTTSRDTLLENTKVLAAYPEDTLDRMLILLQYKISALV